MLIILVADSCTTIAQLNLKEGTICYNHFYLYFYLCFEPDFKVTIICTRKQVKGEKNLKDLKKRLLRK